MREEIVDLTRDTPESLAWQAVRSDAAAAFLAGLPARDAFAKSVEAKLTDTRLAPVFGRGGRWFQTAVLEPTAEQPVVVVRDSPTGEPRVLLDPNELSAKRGTTVSTVVMAPSPDGRVLAVTVQAAGLEQSELLLIDVQTGALLPDEIPWNVGNIAWSADSTSVWCATREVIEGAVECPVYQHVLGRPPGDPVPAPKGLADCRPFVSADDRYVGIASGNTEPRIDWIVENGEMRPFLRDLPGGFAGRFLSEDLIAVVDHGSPRGRLVRIPVATASDTSTWVELVAESDDVIRSVDVVGDVIVLGYLREATSRLRLLDLDGVVLEEIATPGEGTVSAYPYGASHPALPMFVTGDDEISFIHSTFDRSWAVYRYVLSARQLEVVTPPAITLDGLVTSTLTAVSADGVSVPAHVVHRGDLDTSVPQPTVVHGYGGFNMAYLPSFLAENAAWIEAGGVFVLAHLRGGSEFGAEWWTTGHREHKQNTFNDLYAISEKLIATGVTSREQLAVKGESNGGLLTGAAIVQRPDLWSAVVCDVPILDLIGYERDPLTYLIGRVEYGDPAIPAEAEWLRDVSPVHNVMPASYPSVLVTAGENDPRCPTWHARSFVGLLQEANTGDRPILLRTYSGQGHGASGLSAMASKSGDWLAFAALATGLSL